MIREDWINTELLDVCKICDNLREPINSKERNKRIEGKKDSELYPYYENLASLYRAMKWDEKALDLDKRAKLIRAIKRWNSWRKGLTPYFW